MVDRGRRRRLRKRLRVSPQFSDQEDPAEQVAHSDAIQSSDSDFTLNHEIETNASQEARIIAKSASAVHAYNQSNTRTWVDKYSDISYQTGLVTSTRKSKEISEWLQAALQLSRPRMLILAGPPGCGKTSALRVAARQLHCSVAIWHAPTTAQRYITMSLLEDFESFIIGHRYQTLQLEQDETDNAADSSRRKLVLVKDLPISAGDSLEKRTTVQNLLYDASRFAQCPIVIVISDSEKGVARTARFLLGAQLLSSPLTETIRVPAVSQTMMRRRIGEILRKEGITAQSERLDSMIVSSMGDIRVTLNALQFSLTQGRDFTSNMRHRQDRAAGRRHRKRMRSASTPKKPLTTLSLAGQDASLGMYHAVSKVLNNKRGKDGSSKYVPEDIIEHTRADPSSFLAFLHHNYPSFFGNINDVVPALRSLCDADCLLPWMQDDLARTNLGDCAASVATRSFLIHNRNAIRSGWRPIRGPESYTVAQKGKEHGADVFRRLSHVLSPAVPTTALTSEVAPFAGCITGVSLRSFGRTADCADSDGSDGANAADLAMDDVEETIHDMTLSPTVVPLPSSAQGNYSRDEEMEEIEDWFD